MSRSFYTSMPVIQCWTSPSGNITANINFHELDNQPIVKWKTERVTDVPSITLTDGSMVTYPLGYRISGSISFQIWPDAYLKQRRNGNPGPQVTEYEMEFMRYMDKNDFPMLFYPHSTNVSLVYDNNRRIEISEIWADREGMAQDRVSAFISFRFLNLTDLFHGYSDNL